MCDWLGPVTPQTLLILNEVHNTAPASGARHAIDSQTTRAVRDTAPKFEHRLFLPATPYNGHRIEERFTRSTQGLHLVRLVLS